MVFRLPLRTAVVIGSLVVLPTAGAAQQPCTSDARRVVDEIYRHILERGADPDSQQWADRLAADQTTVREIVREVTKSPEHQERFLNTGRGAAAHERAMATLYRHLLGRQPDNVAARTYAQSAMTRGFNSVVDDIVASRDYEQAFGDWGVPGSGGMTFCSARATPRNRNTYNPSNPGNTTGGRAGANGRAAANNPELELWFRDYDKNGDRQITQGEWDGGSAEFGRLDRDRNGSLNRNEFAANNNDTLTRFFRLDGNSDRRISVDEWTGPRRGFDRLDLDRDGFVTPREYRGGGTATTGR